MRSWISQYKKVIVNTLIIVTLVVVSICILVGLLNGNISLFLQNFWTIISPIVIGFIIAYLSNPIVSFFEKYLFRWLKNFKVKRFISILITFILIIAFVIFLVTMLLPSVFSTLASFWDTYVVHYESSVISLSNRINSIMDSIHLFDRTQRLDPEAVLAWIQDTLPWLDNLSKGNFSGIIPNSNVEVNSSESSNSMISDILSSKNFLDLFDYAFNLGSSLFTAIKDTVLGIFIAFYMLMSKEKWKAQIRRFLNVIFSPKHVRAIIRFAKLLDRSFGGFIEGQLLDAIVVGIISYVVFSIFGLPIPHLLATIIAVTNVIPIFGPFIGGIPAAFIVFLTAPEKTILFVALIVIIQQIDGNIICPHILGDKINISSLTTIIAIITMGGLFGIFGMLIGVPVFAVAVNIIQGITLNTLRRKGFETSLEYYYVGDVENISEPNTSQKPIGKLFNKIISFFKSTPSNHKTHNTNKNEET